ncbi:MAG: flagellar hook capping protein [Alphaproteobacteria bacterium]|nr:flagellar hook capping protein [Alphaproteobacteria bacterium]MBV9694046.1 flagellar hook capping protein [Alphaproteobacteria bacterium]
MAVAPVNSTQQVTQSAFGLDFQSLLKIILTELTYQDPLKPVDNYEFVSQLGQFSQLQLSQTLNDNVTHLLASQAATQAVGLIGRTVDFNSGSGGTTLSGQVTAVSFSSGQPLLTIQTADGTTVGDLSIADISQIR